MQTARGASLSDVEPSGDNQTAHGSAATKPRRFVLLLIVAAVALAADYATKEIALARFSPQDPVELLGGLLRFTLIFNPGAAFSIGTGVTWLLTLIALGVVVYILRVARTLRSTGWALALGLILGGASGNLMDRFFREPAPLHGWVVDWIQLPNWPVFNIADSCIVTGGVLVVILAFRGINPDGTRESEREAAAAAAAAEGPVEDEAQGPSGSGERPSGTGGGHAPGTKEDGGE
ncbi:signal peptidase II [Marinitenerispora sediminis]|uniref:signal peptidase II n=1 Tax=Marinitenerispora sediminis TaxID=1931232 RepID=UPI002D795891|nr:signal peptidase II [Marinitenerispora sediminis]